MTDTPKLDIQLTTSALSNLYRLMVLYGELAHRHPLDNTLRMAANSIEGSTAALASAMANIYGPETGKAIHEDARTTAMHWLASIAGLDGITKVEDQDAVMKAIEGKITMPYRADEPKIHPLLEH